MTTTTTASADGGATTTTAALDGAITTIATTTADGATATTAGAPAAATTAGATTGDTDCDHDRGGPRDAESCVELSTARAVTESTARRVLVVLCRGAQSGRSLDAHKTPRLDRCDTLELTLQCAMLDGAGLRRVP